jgi:hypothetical protein
VSRELIAGPRPETNRRSANSSTRTGGTARALLPDPRLDRGRRGRTAGDVARGLAGTRQLRGTCLDSHLAQPDRQQPPPERVGSAGRRPRMEMPLVPDLPEPTRLSEVVWLEPYPDVLLQRLSDSPPGPEARYEERDREPPRPPHTPSATESPPSTARRPVDGTPPEPWALDTYARTRCPDAPGVGGPLAPSIRRQLRRGSGRSGGRRPRRSVT